MRRVNLVALLLLILFIFPAQSSAHHKLHILAIGDSLTWGVGASSTIGGYAHLVARDLGADYAAMPGRSLYHARRNWPAWGWRNVDLIIVQFALHDINSDAGLISDEDWPIFYGQFLDDLHGATGARIIVATTFWAGVTEAGNPNRYERTLLYNGFIKVEADKRDFVRLVDWWGLTEGCTECLSSPADTIPWPGMEFRGDGFHPGGYGHRVLADAVLGAWRGWYKSYAPVSGK